MKKTFLLFYIACLAVFLVACIAQPAVNTSNQPPVNTNDQPTAEGCVFKDGQCCLGENCAIVMPNCPISTTPQVRSCDEDCLPVGECVADSAEPADNFQTYENSQPAFQFKYPAGWQLEVTESGVRTNITLKDLENGYLVADFVVAILSYMPNQGGVALSEWVSEVSQSSGWLPVLTTKPIEIDGVVAYQLFLPKSDAGWRYLFISADKMTMYDWQVNKANSEVVYSFEFLQ